jgi:hypothetical protein
MSDPLARITPMEFGPCTKSDRLTDALDRATALMVAASSEALRLVALHDEQKLWERGGATSMTSWLAARYGLAWGTAREWVRVAHALRDLPKIFEAYAQGRLSWDQFAAPHPFCQSRDRRLLGGAGARASSPDLVSGGRPARTYAEAERGESAQNALAIDVVGPRAAGPVPRGDAPRRAGRCLADRARATGGAGCAGGSARLTSRGPARGCPGGVGHRVGGRSFTRAHVVGARRSRNPRRP